MYRYFLVLIICVSMLSSCAKNEMKENAAIDMYKSYYSQVLSQDSYLENSEYFTLSTEMTRLSDGSYRYYVIVDEPTTAMYHCRIFAVEDDIPYQDNDKMMPTLGIFDTDVSLIPNKIDKAHGFMKGLVISGESDKDHIELKLVVQWNDESGKSSNEQYLKTTIQYQQ
ncbi:MAG: hypothetical protein MR283_08545 [Erysipelotrichaceae bacterium]|nr:hypothetical protein [Erysipelotrichaceae bacterium]MDY6034948.1 hypothetical protein [Bulleidia sp.]